MVEATSFRRRLDASLESGLVSVEVRAEPLPSRRLACLSPQELVITWVTGPGWPAIESQCAFLVMRVPRANGDAVNSGQPEPGDEHR